MQKLKGLWIPAEILLDEELTDKEKIILSIIVYLSEENKSCFASNKYIASIVNVTSDRVSKIISSLKDKKYINLRYKTDSKEIKSREISIIKESIRRYSRNHRYSIGENNYSNSQKQPYPLGEKDKDIIINYNNINKYNSGMQNKKKYEPYRSDRNFDNFDWNSLYAN